MKNVILMVRKLKYKIVDGRNHIVHHSYNKRNAENWIRLFGKKSSNYFIKKIKE